MEDRRTENRGKLQSLLRDLFQFDHADLDFGIYRIMNEKRDEVERFIEHDLLDVVEEALARFREVDRDELERELAQKREQLGSEALDADGDVRDQFRGMPIAQDYMELRRQLRETAVAAETEARVFNDLWRFFSRYYDQGDFLTERRYSSRGAKYCVPYNGEEVMLHWANRDQYYVKTSERFTDYRFNARPATSSGPAYTVWFRLQQAEVPQDNVRGDTRYFVLHEERSLSYDEETRTLTIPFAYRPLSEEEEAHYLDLYNAQQSRSNRRKTLDRSVLCAALETEILERLDQPDLRAALAAVAQGKETSALGRHLNRYTARHTMDYFVHKDLGGFLRRELDVFLKTDVMHLGDLVSEESADMAQHVLTRMRVVRQIANRVIDFLAQVEDFQKRLFEKRKFVVQTDYCITLGRVPEDFYTEILANQSQLDEWRELYAIDEWPEDLFWQGTFDEAFLKHHPYLMIDTAFFDRDFKARLLATFDDLDGATDGVLIHGENFQALNLLMAKYDRRVKCVYIDPPYNSKTSEILYKNTYKHSSWLALMENRLAVSRGLSTGDGSHIVAIDENEQERLGLLLERLFPSHERVCVAVRHNKKGIQGDYFSYNHDYAYFCLPPGLQETNEEEIPEDEWEYANLRKWGSESRRHTAKNCFYPILVRDKQIVGFGDVCPDDYHPASSNIRREDGIIEVYPVDSEGIERKWRYARASVPDIRSALKVHVTREGRIQILKAKITFRYKTMWTDERYIAGDYGTRVLTEMGLNPGENLYPKSIHTVRDSVYAVSDPKSLVVDYFAGSGTTGHAVMKLNQEDGGERKYIMVEMGDYFDTVLKPRILKVAFSANWKDGVPQDRDGMSHMVKYHRIESYEDALNNIRVQQPEGGQLELLRQFDDYMLHYMLDFETRDSPSLLAQEAFEKPFDYTLRIQQGQESPEDTTVDLVEMFHYLIGMQVRRLERYEHQGRTYVVSRGEVSTERGIDHVVTIWRDTEGLDLEEEAEWVNADVLTDLVDRVYVNGYENFIRDAQPTEIAFRQRMEGV